jgi:hypothetical protein
MRLYQVTLKLITALLLALTIQSCALTSLIPSTPTVGLEATLGDKEESLVGQVGSKQEIAVESLSGGLTTNNIQQVPIEFMLLMVLGWLLPSPSEIYRELKAGLTSILNIFRRGDA